MTLHYSLATWVQLNAVICQHLSHTQGSFALYVHRVCVGLGMHALSIALSFRPSSKIRKWVDRSRKRCLWSNLAGEREVRLEVLPVVLHSLQSPP